MRRHTSTRRVLILTCLNTTANAPLLQVTRYRASAIVISIGLAVAGIVLWSVTRSDDPSDTAEVTELKPSQGESSVNQAASPQTDATPPPLPEPLALTYHCAALSHLLDSGDPGVGWPEWHDVSDDCRNALDRQFLDASVSDTILPASSPSWRDVFNGLPEKVEIVSAALQDENCVVPDGEIQTHLASECAARAMAEVAVVTGACGVAHSQQWIEVLTGLPRSVPRDNIYGHYLSRILPGHLRLPVDTLASESSDQESYWRDRESLEELSLRTPWIKHKCDSLEGRPSGTFDVQTLDSSMLMARAAKLGDGFALAHYAGPPSHVEALMDVEPVQAFIHLARTEARDAHGAGGFEFRVGPDGRINAAQGHASPEGWRSKKETDSATYVLAAEMLAAATNVTIDRDMLHRITDPNDPSYATAADLYEARLQAEELVADALARTRPH